ncbi:MAG: DUF523 domain-containing protein [Pseudomonadota bacterium]
MISACLLGEAVRYDGKSKLLAHSGLQELMKNNQVIGFCPEVAGDLPVPRPAAEILDGNGDNVLSGTARVRTKAGEDVTSQFLIGAQRALDLCLKHNIKIAVLTQFSPSCGSGEIYDGSFKRRKKSGSGVTTALLRQQGIQVFDQFELDQAIKQLKSDSNREKPQSSHPAQESHN